MLRSLNFIIGSHRTLDHFHNYRARRHSEHIHILVKPTCSVLHKQVSHDLRHQSFRRGRRSLQCLYVAHRRIRRRGNERQAEVPEMVVLVPAEAEGALTPNPWTRHALHDGAVAAPWAPPNPTDRSTSMRKIVTAILAIGIVMSAGSMAFANHKKPIRCFVNPQGIKTCVYQSGGSLQLGS